MEFGEWLSKNETAIRSLGDWESRDDDRGRMLRALRQWVDQYGETIAGKRIHIGRNGLVPTDTPQTLKSPHEKRINGKPWGIWYAHGRAWIGFILFEHPGGVDESIYEIQINPSRILFVNTAEQAAELENRFAVKTPEDLEKHGWYEPKNGMVHSTYRHKDGTYTTRLKARLLNWEAMRPLWDGIEVDVDNVDAAWADHRSWNIASGCVWNKSGITGTREIARYDSSRGVYVNL